MNANVVVKGARDALDALNSGLFVPVVVFLPPIILSAIQKKKNRTVQHNEKYGDFLERIMSSR